MTNDISQRAALEFLKSYNKQERQEENKKNANKKIIDAKNQHLIPLRRLLKTLVDAGVHVTHTALYDHGMAVRPQAPQPLQVWEGEPSPRWQPGTSLYLDHPGSIEITIASSHQRDEYGLVVISCSTEHPDRHLLQGPFHTEEEACMALAQFLSQSTLRIDRPQDLENLFGIEEW